MKYQRMTVDNLEKEIEKKKLLINKLIWCKEFKCSNTQEIILKKYIELQSVVNVAKEINELGLRLESPKGERKYIPLDITGSIKYKETDTNEELYSFAKMLQKKNKKASQWKN